MVGDNAEALRDEAMCLARIGILKMTIGDFLRAEEAYEETLRLMRRIRVMVGETSEAARRGVHFDEARRYEAGARRSFWGGKDV